MSTLRNRNYLVRLLTENDDFPFWVLVPVTLSQTTVSPSGGLRNLRRVARPHGVCTVAETPEHTGTCVVPPFADHRPTLLTTLADNSVVPTTVLPLGRPSTGRIHREGDVYDVHLSGCD